jgi:hypothetical protein
MKNLEIKGGLSALVMQKIPETLIDKGFSPRYQM